MPIISHTIQFTEGGGVLVFPFSDNVTPTKEQSEALLGVFSAVANGNYDLFVPERGEHFLAFLNDAEALRLKYGYEQDEEENELDPDVNNMSEYTVRLRSDSPYLETDYA